MNQNLSFMVLPVIFLLLFCNQPGKIQQIGIKVIDNQSINNSKLFNYNLKHPTKKIKLPLELQEISALSFFEPNLLMAVQDENADIYTIDYQKEEISEHYVANEIGDFEGIEVVGQNVYVLKSNGTIIEHQNFAKNSHQIKRYNTVLTGKNDTEGLAYNAANNSLLITCKNKAALKDMANQFESFRCIYQFNLDAKKLNEKPWCCIDLKQLKKEFGFENFMPSAIAIHPVDSSIYVISSVGKLLLTINNHGNILKAEKLDPEIFKQPEGICFSPNGELLFISNEGKKKNGYILQFNKL